MGKPLNLLGQKFARLKVIKKLSNDKKSNSVWLCECDCGTFRKVIGYLLRNGNTKSCGCYNRELIVKRNFKHGHAYRNGLKHSKYTPIYNSWRAMRERCHNEKAFNYKWYGERGITICERWKDSFKNFLADMGKRPVSHSLDRKDSNGNYNLKNCKWSTQKEQVNNPTNKKPHFKGKWKRDKKGRFI